MFKQAIGFTALVAAAPVIAPYFTSYSSEDVETGIQSIVQKVKDGEVRDTLESQYGELTLDGLQETFRHALDRAQQPLSQAKAGNPFTGSATPSVTHPPVRPFSEFQEGVYGGGASCINADSKNFDPLSAKCE